MDHINTWITKTFHETKGIRAQIYSTKINKFVNKNPKISKYERNLANDPLSFPFLVNKYEPIYFGLIAIKNICHESTFMLTHGK